MPPSLQSRSIDPLRGVLAASQASTTSLYGKTNGPHITTSIVALRYWRHVLHGILSILQIVLLAMLWSHPERHVTVAFDNSILTIGPSTFLQAFYTVCDTRGTKHTFHNVFSCILRYWSS